MTAAFAAGTVAGAVVVMGSIGLLIGVLAWIAKHGFRSLLAEPKRFVRELLTVRGEAVMEWQEEDPEPKSSSEALAAEDQAIAVAAASNDDHFALWEREFGERAQ